MNTGDGSIRFARPHGHAVEVPPPAPAAPPTPAEEVVWRPGLAAPGDPEPAFDPDAGGPPLPPPDPPPPLPPPPAPPRYADEPDYYRPRRRRRGRGKSTPGVMMAKCSLIGAVLGGVLVPSVVLARFHRPAAPFAPAELTHPLILPYGAMGAVVGGGLGVPVGFLLARPEDD